jgi:circadian clock protein KaiC
MAHSNQIREFLLTNDGIQLQDVYIGAEGVLTGSMRMIHEARSRAAAADHQRMQRQSLRLAAQKRKAIEAQIAVLQAELSEQEDDAKALFEDDQRLDQEATEHLRQLAQSRQVAINGEGNVTERHGAKQ